MTKSWLFRVLLGLLALFVVACGAIMFDGLNDRLHAADLAVVLGNKVNPDGQPSEMLRARLDHAVLLFSDGYVKTILVSGGKDRAGHDEADVMSDYLFRAGIPSSAIFKDHEGTNTFHTARNTARFLNEHHLQSVLIVSQYFHITRCRLAFKRFGISPVDRVPTFGPKGV
jgi:vancomycin permeability regulator SanA